MEADGPLPYTFSCNCAKLFFLGHVIPDAKQFSRQTKIKTVGKNL